MLTAEKNRMRLAARDIQRRVRAHITWWENELESINTDLMSTMRQSPVWREHEEVLRSVPGWAGAHHHPLRQLAGIGNLDTQRSGGLSGRRPVPA